MKILVIGKQGQLARCLADRVSRLPDLTFHFTSRSEIDLTRLKTIRDTIRARDPDLVINPAAYTAVDDAEDEPERAMMINAEAAGVVAEEAAHVDAGILHVSTDYVFDGTLERPYHEKDPVAPLGIYGRSKRAGEEAVMASNPRHAILRTAWLYSPYGNNFVHTMLNLARTREALNVVNDQSGTPTSALDLAEALLLIAKTWQRGSDLGCGEIYHVAGAMDATRFSFAKAILAESERLGGPYATVSPVPSSAFPTKAERPKNSRLDTAKFRSAFNLTPSYIGLVDPAIIQSLIGRLNAEQAGATFET